MMGKYQNLILKLAITPFSLLRKMIGKCIIFFFVLVFRLLPIDFSVSVVEKSKFYEQLDYKKKKIRMKIDSLTQLDRTKGCKKEPETVKWIEEFIKTDDVFYDIGANVGAYSLICSAHNEGLCRIYSFEPSFSTYSALCENILINGYNDNIIAFPVILSNETKLKKFFYSDTSPGSASHSIDLKLSYSNVIKDNQNPAQVTTINEKSRIFNFIESFRLDDLISLFNLPKPNHMKIDVDGHELEVLMGCENLLDSYEMQSILIEIDKTNSEYPKIFEILKQKNFEVVSVHPHGDGIISNYIYTKVERQNRTTTMK